MYRSRSNFKPRYNAKFNGKRTVARKRQGANLVRSRALYTKYSAPRSLSQTTQYPIRRMFLFGALVTSAAFTDALAYFRLNQLPDYTELTALYDQYKVDKLVFHFISSITDLNIANSIQDVGTLLTAVDFDGGATGLTQTQFLSYESCQMTPHTKNKVLTIRPKAEMALVDASGTTVSGAISSTDNTWYDCSNTNVQFNGVRWATTAESGSTGYHIYYTCWVEAFVTFKNTR